MTAENFVDGAPDIIDEETFFQSASHHRNNRQRSRDTLTLPSALTPLLAIRTDQQFKLSLSLLRFYATPFGR